MNKRELLENYTMEQLADMVIEKDKYLEELGNQLTDKHEFEELIKNEYVSVINAKQGEIENLKSALCRKEITINQIDDILNELFGVTHDVTEKPEEFKEILEGNINGYISIQQDPIDISSDLIKAFCWQGKEYLPMESMELKQIADHLLIYCNANAKRGTKNDREQPQA